MDIEKNNRKKLERILIIGVLAIFVVVSVTYAFFQAQLGDGASADVDLSSDTTDSLKFSVSGPISLNINQFNFGVGAGNLDSSATATATLLANNNTKTATFNYYVYFRINSNEYVYTTSDSKPEIILTVTDPEGNPVTSIDGLTYVENVQTITSDGSTQTVSGFDITTAKGLFAVASNYSITANSTTQTIQNWEFTATFINLDSDQQNNTGKTMNAEIIIQQEEKVGTLAELCSGKSMAECIATQLYTVDGENGLYFHDGQGTYGSLLEAGDNSYRFSGANPNNYVCFGSTESPCPEENLYRIIGAFDDDKDGNYQIKLIKSDYVTSDMLGTDGDYDGAYDLYDSSDYKGSMDTSTIAGYRWNNDTSVNRYGSNNWTTSEFNTINLNTNYWNYLGTTWQNLIAETTWHLGGMTPGSNTAKAFYNGERNNAGYGSNPTTYTDEIGLMYPSDFGYAASPDAWTTNLGSYNNSNNWLYMGLSEWTITPNSSSARFVFSVNSGCYLNSISVLLGNSARPVFYLESNVALQGGSGTSNDPYRLAV